MKHPTIHSLFLVFAMLSITGNAYAFGLGLGKSGGKFDYEACGKIIEGKTTWQEAEKMLDGEPISTGKSGSHFYRLYSYEKGGALGLSKLGIGASAGKAVNYKCHVTHNKAGIVTLIDMQEIAVGSNGVGL